MTTPSVHYRTCHLCEAMCGVAITHADGKVLSIHGDKNDPLSGGHVCAKVMALKDVHEDPDRLRVPVKRIGKDWVEISWDEAYQTIAREVAKVRKAHGNDAIGVYVGNPTAHTPALLLIPAFIAALGATRRFSATSVDQLPTMLASLQMFGHQLLFPVPDLDRTDFVLMVGGNPAASGGSLMSGGDIMGRLKALRARGGRLIVVDPRRTETAEKADEHHFIKPGTDFFFLAAIANVLMADGITRLAHLSAMVEGMPALQTAIAPFTPEVVAPITGIAADDIRRLARSFAKAPRAICYGRVGACLQEFGGLTTWMINVLNVLTGNLDAEGGTMFSNPPLHALDIGPKGEYGRQRSRMRGLPSFGGELPASVLAEEILTSGKGQIRVLATHAGNPVLSTPNGRQLDEALASLDFMFSVDLYINETTRHAHIILPPTSALERSHIDLGLSLVTIRNVAKWSPAMLPAPVGSRQDWQILLDLSLRIGAAARLGGGVRDRIQRVAERLGLDAAIDLILRTGPYGTHGGLLQSGASLKARLKGVIKPNEAGLSLKKLAEHPHGIDLGPLRRVFPQALKTRNKRIKLAPDLYLRDLPRAMARLGQPENAEMRLIGRRHVRSNNSWLHNSLRLVKGKPRCTAWIHPRDAERLGVEQGGLVRVQSRVGEITLPAEVSDHIMPGVVSVPHGWGHGREGVRLRTATTVPGVSLNDVTDEQFIDHITGMSAMNGLPVQVQAVTEAVSRRSAA